jgi:hypothetical protein
MAVTAAQAGATFTGSDGADRTGLTMWEYKIYELPYEMERCETELNASTFRTPCVHLKVGMSGHESRGASAWSGEDELHDYVGTVAADDAAALLDGPSLMSLLRSIAITTPSWEST